MSHPERPAFISQDPNHGGSCVHNGREFGWSNCTCVAMATLIRQATLGRQTPDGCDIRILTGDWSGGTMLSQVAEVAHDEYGVKVDVFVGSNFIDPDHVHELVRDGHGAVIQGNAVAMVETPHQSTRGAVNHAVYAQERRASDGAVHVWDPARSNRISSFGHVTNGPEWWSWALMLKFMAELRPWGDDDPRKLGRGRAYAAIGPDKEPHVHLRYAGSHPTATLPRKLTIVPAVPHERANLRSGPSTKYPVRRTLPKGAIFNAYQRNDKGQELVGSRTWFGGHGGGLWVHSSNVKGG